MKKFFKKYKEALVRKVGYLLRRSQAIQTFVQTRDNHGLVRYYDSIAIPQSMKKDTYDVRIKRYVPGDTVKEIYEFVWSRERVQQYVRDCS